MVYKFLQHVPNGNKVYEKLTETIKTNMTEQDMTAVFDEVQNKVSSYSSNIMVKEKVFVANGADNIPKMIADLQDQINNLRSNYHGITADGNPEESNNNVEDKDEDDHVYFGRNRSQTKQRMFCTICRKRSSFLPKKKPR